MVKDRQTKPKCIHKHRTLGKTRQKCQSIFLMYSVKEKSKKKWVCGKQSWLGFYSNEIIKPHPLGSFFTQVGKDTLSAFKLQEYCQCSRRPLLVFCDLFYPTLSCLRTTSLGPDTVMQNTHQTMYSLWIFLILAIDKFSLEFIQCLLEKMRRPLVSLFSDTNIPFNVFYWNTLQGF